MVFATQMFTPSKATTPGLARFNLVSHQTLALMLGSDRSQAYCLEMIYAVFLAGANLDNGDLEMLLFSMTRFFKFLRGEQRQAFLAALREKAS